MNIEQVVGQMGEASVLNSPDSGTRAGSGEDAHNGTFDLATSIAQTCLGSAGKEVQVHAAKVLPSIAPGEVDSIPPSSNSHVSTIGDTAISQKSLLIPSSAIEEAAHDLVSSAGNPVALVGDIADANVIGAAENIKDKAQALVLTRVRTIVFVYVAKLPIVGSYFAVPKDVGESSADIVATETTPLLGALQDPKAFATKQAEGLLRRLLSPLLSRIPDIDALDNVEPEHYGLLFKTFVECYALTREGGGWLL